ncbi:hypothetical protein Tco_0894888 [Tanacetum coccineum]|uniref:Uncharacterized protein n=1 Tax=Tanacetum coccineum TaxID=301880 RepID=A0ABQ5CCY4_9ASTR
MPTVTIGRCLVVTVALQRERTTAAAVELAPHTEHPCEQQKEKGEKTDMYYGIYTREELREEALTETGQNSVPVPETALTVCTTRLRGELHTILEDMDRYPNLFRGVRSLHDTVGCEAPSCGKFVEKLRWTN